MKNKYFYTKIFGIASLIFLVFIYIIFYFVPSVESINRYKRDLKSTKLRIKDFVKMERVFSFSTEREKEFFREIDGELKSKFPEIANREDLINLFAKVSDYIQNLARKDGILNLIIKINSKEIEKNSRIFSTDTDIVKRLLNFTESKLSEIKNQNEINKKNRTSGNLVGRKLFLSNFGNLKYCVIFLSFTGELKNVLNFINHIPWATFYLNEERIFISENDFSPNYLVFLKMYYIDKRKDIFGKSKEPMRAEFEVEKGLLIDFNSKILLKEVFMNLTEKYNKKELPIKIGTKVFKSKISSE